MQASIAVISDFNDISEIEDLWNAFVRKWSENPCLLSGFVKYFIQSSCLDGWTPMILVVSLNNKVIGIFPLKTRKRFGIRVVKFLSEPWFFPDLISNCQYREICVTHVLSFLIKTLKCPIVDLTLSIESKTLPVLYRVCKNNGIRFCVMPKKGHRVLPFEGNRAEFERSMGGKRACERKRLIGRLNRAGSWRVLRVDTRGDESTTIKRILDIEKRSWKEEQRTKKRIGLDRDLVTILRASQYIAGTEPDFSWNVWFLELDDEAIAYVLVLEYQQLAFIAKTSFDNRFRSLAPGIVLMDALILGLFNMGHIRKIDFVTDLPFMKTWASQSIPKVRTIVFLRNNPLSMILSAIADKPLNDILVRLLRRLRYVTNLID